MKLCVFFMVAVVGSVSAAETLNQWLAGQVQRDEQLLVDALAQNDGSSIDLLKDSRTYVPFFLEEPKGAKFTSLAQKEAFEALMQDGGQSFLAGGYVYRLKFKTAAPLYAMSAGEWNGSSWRSIALGKDILIEPSNAWEASNGEYLYATLVAGTLPRLISYDQSGEVAHQETFDATAADFEQRLKSAIAPYASSRKPDLEMISLAEYLKQPDAPWRAVDATGQFNLRNQHQRPDEQERLKQAGHLTRSAAVSGLSTNTSTTTQPAPTPKPPPAVQPPTPKKAPSSSPAMPPNEEPTTSTPWRIIIIVITAACGLLWLWFKRRS